MALAGGFGALRVASSLCSNGALFGAEVWTPNNNGRTMTNYGEGVGSCRDGNDHLITMGPG